MQYRYVAPLISLRSKWRLTGFSRRFTPKNPVRLHNPFGELPRWGAKNVLPLNLIAFPTRGMLCVGDSTIPIQPPPLLGTSFQRKEGVSTRAPSLGRGCRAQRGGVSFLFCGEAASSLPSQGERRCVKKSGVLVSLPSPLGKGDRVSGG